MNSKWSRRPLLASNSLLRTSSYKIKKYLIVEMDNSIPRYEPKFGIQLVKRDTEPSQMPIIGTQWELY